MDDENQTEPNKRLKSVASMAAGIAGCALATFAFGAILGAPWPAAVASCGLSAMGAAVAFFMLRR